MNNFMGGCHESARCHTMLSTTALEAPGNDSKVRRHDSHGPTKDQEISHDVLMVVDHRADVNQSYTTSIMQVD